MMVMCVHPQLWQTKTFCDGDSDDENEMNNSTPVVTGSRVFSLTYPLGSLGPELMATLFQPNPRSEA
ncbi:hypothetical protein TNCV_1587361 [Trichonephila clavipes]|uniref:Uncharacterized protein n=1 Tax=Trichonephila clavipes TaxID=2585209 RepID=A0A8X6V3U6_TRICX|nr:hypothetical protein TNCV_1587361 [Trichonephila clavipes]